MPLWTIFQSRVDTDVLDSQFQIIFNHIIMASPTDFSTVFTILKRTKEQLNSLGQRICPIVFDMGLLGAWGLFGKDTRTWGRFTFWGWDAFVKGVLERIGADWEYWKVADVQITDMSNNMVLATGRYQAKNKKNGKEINAQVAHVWTLKNGKVVVFQQYTDTKQVAEAVK